MINITDRVLSELCRQYEIRKDDLNFLGGGRGDSDGTAYTFEKSGKKKVLKILAIEEEKQQDLKTFEERVIFANYLGENGVGIVYPDKRSDGSLYASCHEEKHVFIAYDMDFCEGSSPETQQLKSS